MGAMQKFAWTELTVSVVSVVVVSLLFPWFGDVATAGFALLALVTLGAVFVRPRDNRIVTDERDREIERRATKVAVSTVWMILVATLATAIIWANYSDAHAVSTRFLNWLIWIQFAVFYGFHGLVVLWMYRRQRNAA